MESPAYATDEELAKNTMPRRRLGENLRRIRQDRGLSLEKLAERLTGLGNQTGPNTVWKIENASRATTVDDLLALGMALDCTISDLLAPLDYESPERPLNSDHEPAPIVVTAGAATAAVRYLDLIGANAHPEIIRNVAVRAPDGGTHWVRPGDRPPGWALLQIEAPIAYLGGRVPPVLDDIQQAARQREKQAVDAAASAAVRGAVDAAARQISSTMETTVSPFVDQVREYIASNDEFRHTLSSTVEWLRSDLDVTLQRLNALMTYAIEQGLSPRACLDIVYRAEVVARGGKEGQTLDQALTDQIERFLVERLAVLDAAASERQAD